MTDTHTDRQAYSRVRICTWSCSSCAETKYCGIFENTSKWSNYKSFFQGTENKFLTRLAYHAGFRWTSAFLIYVHLSRTSSWNGLIFLPPFSHSIAQKLSTTIAMLETFDQLWVDIKEWWSYFDCANPRESFVDQRYERAHSMLSLLPFLLIPTIQS